MSNMVLRDASASKNSDMTSLLPEKWNITLAGKTSILILEGDASLGRGG